MSGEVLVDRRALPTDEVMCPGFAIRHSTLQGNFVVATEPCSDNALVMHCSWDTILDSEYAARQLPPSLRRIVPTKAVDGHVVMALYLCYQRMPHRGALNAEKRKSQQQEPLTRSRRDIHPHDWIIDVAMGCGDLTMPTTEPILCLSSAAVSLALQPHEAQMLSDAETMSVDSAVVVGPTPTSSHVPTLPVLLQPPTGWNRSEVESSLLARFPREGPNAQPHAEFCQAVKRRGELEDLWYRCNAVLPNPAQCTLSTFLQLVGWIQSRCLEHNGRSACVPVIEKLNHSADTSNCPTVEWGRYVELRVDRGLAAQEEVCINYGARSNARFLTHYGFVADAERTMVIELPSPYPEEICEAIGIAAAFLPSTCTLHASASELPTLLVFAFALQFASQYVALSTAAPKTGADSDERPPQVDCLGLFCDHDEDQRPSVWDDKQMTEWIKATGNGLGSRARTASLTYLQEYYVKPLEDFIRTQSTPEIEFLAPDLNFWLVEYCRRRLRLLHSVIGCHDILV